MVLAAGGLAAGSVPNLTSGGRSAAGAGSNVFPRAGRASHIFGCTAHHGRTGRDMTRTTSRRLRRPSRSLPTAEEVWCVFDNTASGAASRTPGKCGTASSSIHRLVSERRRDWVDSRLICWAGSSYGSCDARRKPFGSAWQPNRRVATVHEFAHRPHRPSEANRRAPASRRFVRQWSSAFGSRTRPSDLP